MTWKKYLMCLLFITAIISGPFVVSAEQTKIDDLKSKIDDRSKTIEALIKQISVYQEQIKATGKETATLQSAIQELNTTQKKLSAEMNVTENKIGSAELTIQKLTLEIGDKEKRLILHENALAETLRKIHESDSRSLLESMLAFARLSAIWSDSDYRFQLQRRVGERIKELAIAKAQLVTDKDKIESVRNELSLLKTELTDRKKAVDYNKQQKASLLTETKNKEQNYKKVLADKTEQKEAFERELFQFESELKFEIDQSKIPEAGIKVLAWPILNPVITQYFGATVDAKRLYVSGTHNGIDLRASNGTPIKAALSGVIEGVGNTDLIKGCYSYGKWVLIKHGNGLSTLYAHLSVISANLGQSVSIGQVIGYSGATGYATGPHLHFTVYATQGVKIQKFEQGINCKSAVMPVSSKSAYLNPMDYLPPR